MPTDRLHLPLLAVIVIAALIIGVTTSSQQTESRQEANRKTPVRPPSQAPLQSLISKLLPEYALTLAECPCPPETGDAGRSILVVQEPVLVRRDEHDPTTNRNPGSCLLWFLKGDHHRPFEEATVLGYKFLTSEFETYTQLRASIAYDSKRKRYWITLIQGGEKIRRWLYQIDPRADTTRTRAAFLTDAATARPAETNPVIGTHALGFNGANPNFNGWISGFGGDNPMKLVTFMTTEIKDDEAGSTLWIQAHSTHDWNNEQRTVKLWKWRYHMESETWFQEDVMDVPRPEVILTAREARNAERRRAWTALVGALINHHFLKSEEPDESAD